MDNLLASISCPRFRKYLEYGANDFERAKELYRWNIALSMSLYPYLQGWEVCLRNRIDIALTDQFGPDWPNHKEFKRQIRSDLVRKIDRKYRKNRNDEGPKFQRDDFIASQSAGFWVILLSDRYRINFGMNRRISLIFPHPPNFDRQAAWLACDKVRMLRNRVAHHEPILALNLGELYCMIKGLVKSMSPELNHFCQESCQFEDAYARKPNWFRV